MFDSHRRLWRTGGFLRISAMRRDMAQVIVERPRLGSSLPSRKKGYRRHLQATAPDEWVCREPMLGRWRGRQRYLNEHLGPMRRFLRSNVGRPWNKVHQELCEHVSFDNAVQKHVLAHVFDFVERDVALRGRIPVYTRGWRRGDALGFGQMYVCPKSGLLKVVRRRSPQARPGRIRRDADRVAILRDGVWWDVRIRKTPEDVEHLWDVWLERCVSQVTKAERLTAFGDDFVAISKRPLTRQESRLLRDTRRNGRHPSRR